MKTIFNPLSFINEFSFYLIDEERVNFHIQFISDPDSFIIKYELEKNFNYSLIFNLLVLKIFNKNIVIQRK